MNTFHSAASGRDVNLSPLLKSRVAHSSRHYRKGWVKLRALSNDGGISHADQDENQHEQHDNKNRQREPTDPAPWVYVQISACSSGNLRLHSSLGTNHICRQPIPSYGPHRERSRNRLGEEWHEPISRHSLRCSACRKSALEAVQALRPISGRRAPGHAIRQ